MFMVQDKRPCYIAITNLKCFRKNLIKTNKSLILKLVLIDKLKDINSKNI